MNKTIIVYLFSICSAFCLTQEVFSANRYFLNNSTDWNDTNNWSSSSGGASGASVPGVGDTVYFDSNSGDCILDVNITVATININATYANTITQGSYTITVNNMTVSGGAFVGGTADITVTQKLTLSAGTFTASAQTTSVGSLILSVSATFQHNNGTFVATTYTDSNVNNSVFYNLKFDTTKGFISNAKIVVENDFILSSVGDVSLTDIEVGGNLSIPNTRTNARATQIVLNGAGVQTVSGGGNCIFKFKVNKASGYVVFDSDINFFRDFRISSGMVEWNEHTANIVFDVGSTIESGFFYNLVIDTVKDIVLSGNSIVTNDLTITNAYRIMNDSIEVRNNIDIDNTISFQNANTTSLTINGISNQIMSGGHLDLTFDIIIDKPSGTLVFDDDFGFKRNYTVLNGSVSWGTYTASFVPNGIDNTTIKNGEFYNLVFDKGGTKKIQLEGDCIVYHTFTAQSGGDIKGGELHVYGDMIFNTASNYGKTSPITLIAKGAENQDLTCNGMIPFNFEINKSNGTLNFETDVQTEFSYTYTAGNIDYNNKVINFSGSNNATITGDLILPNVIVSKSTSNILTIQGSGNLTVSNNLTLDACKVNGNIIYFGNQLEILGNNATSSTVTIMPTVTGDQTITGTANLNILLRIDKTAGKVDFSGNFNSLRPIMLLNGTVNQNDSNISLASNDSYGRFEMSGGTFNGADKKITCSIFRLSGGTFNSTSAILQISALGSGIYTLDITGGTFNHNNGTVSLVGTNHTILRNLPAYPLSTFIHDCTGNVSGSIYIEDHYNVLRSHSAIWPTAYLKGDFDSNAGFPTALYLEGSKNQTINPGSNIAEMTINKTGGTVNFTNDFEVMRGWNHIAGDINWHNHKVTFLVASNSLSIQDGLFYDLEIVGGNNIGSGRATPIILNDFIWSRTNGTFPPVTVHGNVYINSSDGSLSDTGILRFAGTGDQTIYSSGNTLNAKVLIDKPSGKVILNDNMALSNPARSFDINAGELDLNGKNLTVAGAMNVYAKLSLIGTETVTVAGDPSNVSGSFTLATGSTVEFKDNSIIAVVTNLSHEFHHLILGTDKIHEFATGGANATIINGLWSSKGTNASPSVLRSLSDSGSTWDVELKGTSALLDKVKVKNSNASAGSTVYAVGSIDDGNNTNWDFLSVPNFTWKGTTDTSWNNSANWQGGAVPGAGDDVFFSELYTNDCVIDVPIHVKSITVMEGYTGTITQGIADIETDDFIFSDGAFIGNIGDIVITNELIINNGDFTSTDDTLQFTKLYLNNGTFNASVGSVLGVDIFILGGTFNGDDAVLSITNKCTQTSGIFNNSTDGLTVKSITMQGGTFNGSSADITISAGFNQTGGTFNCTSGTLSVLGPGQSFTFSNGSFNHNNGTVNFVSASSAEIRTKPNNGFFNVNLNVQSSLSGTLYVDGDLDIGTAVISTNDITIYLKGNYSGTMTNIRQYSSISFIGSGDQYFYANTAPSVTINKPSGTLYITSNKTCGANWSHLAGTIDWGGYKLTNGLSTFTIKNGSFYDLELATNSAVSIANDSNCIVMNSLTINNVASFSSSTKHMIVHGNVVFTDAGYTVTTSTQKIILAGSGSQNITGAGVCGHILEITKPSGVVQLGANLTITNSKNLIITQGDLYLNGYDLNVANQFIVDDTLALKGIETIVVNGITAPAPNPDFAINASSTIEFKDSASVATVTNVARNFHNLILGANKTHLFEHGAANRITINGDFSSTGTDSTQAKLRSTVDGMQWEINLSGTSSLLDTVDVKDSNASSGPSIIALNSTDSTNNTHWVFATKVVNVTSTKPNGSYGEGSAISIQITFNSNVWVTGTPRLTLETGAVDQTTNYVSGSGTDTLTFNYIVQVNDETSDLDYKNTSALTLDGGTIKNALNQDAVLILPTPGAAGSLGYNKDIEIITVVPTIVNVTSSVSDGAYGIGQIIGVKVVFDIPVWVTNKPSLILETGSVDRTIYYASGSGTDTLTFEYVIQPGDVSSDLDYVANNVLSLNGGTIKDAAFHNADLTLPDPGDLGSLGHNKNIVIDTGVPEILSIKTTKATAIYGTNAPIDIEVIFSKPVSLAGVGSKLRIALNTNPIRYVDISTISNSTTASGIYSVQAGDISSQLKVTEVSVIDGTLRDIANNDLKTIIVSIQNIDEANTKTITIEATAPKIINITSSTINNIYGVGQLINIHLTFDKAIATDGNMEISLDTSAVVTIGSFAGEIEIDGTYMVGTGHLSNDLTVTSIAMESGKTAADAYGNPLNFSTPAGHNLADNKALVIDAVVPKITNISSLKANGTYGVGEEITIDLTFDKAITTTGDMKITLDTGAIVTIGSFAGQITASATYTVNTNESSADLNVMSIVMDSGVATDAYGNPLNLTPPGGANLANNKDIVIDAVVPTITNINSLKADGTYGVGEVITIDLTFDKAITTTGDMKITLDTGAIVTIGSFAGQTTVSGNYTVSTGESSADLNVMSIVMNSGVATDAYGNPLNLTPPGGANLANNKDIVIDAVVPTITNISSLKADGTYGVGEVITIDITFDKAITTTGNMKITLDTSAEITIGSFAGQTTVSGNYTVGTGESSADLNVMSIVMDSGVAKDAYGNPLDLTPPGGANLANNKDIVIDAVVPTITNISSLKADGTYGVGEVIVIDFTFSKAITTTGDMKITLDTNAIVTIGSFAGQTTVSGNYTVGTGDSSADLNVMSIVMDSGVAKDAYGNSLSLNLPVGHNLADNKALVIDAVVPTITNITSAKANGTYGVGEVITIDLTFDKAITTTGDMKITLDTNAIVTIGSFAGQTTVSGNYTVGTGESSADLNVTSIVMDSGVAKDAYGNPLNLTPPGGANLANNKALVIDAVVPTITNISSLKADGTYGVGEVIVIDFTFSKAITTTGDMKITLDTNAIVTIGSFSGQTTVSGNYTVGTGDSSADLNVMSIVMDSGVAKDAYGNPLSLNLPVGHNLADNKALVIDAVVPTITNISSLKADGTYGVGEVITIDITFDKAITTTGDMKITLDTSAVVTIGSFTGQTTVSGNYTVGAGESSADLNVTSIVMDSGVAKDAYGNPLSLNLPAGHNLADNKALVIDAVVPTITNISSLKADGTYGVGEVIVIDFTFSKAITTTGDMKITLDTNAIVTIGSFAGQTTASGNYTVGTGDSSADLNVMSIVMDSGVAKDAYGNSLSLNLPVGHNLADNKALVIDAVVPTITNISSLKADGTYGVGEVITIDITFDKAITTTGDMKITLDTSAEITIPSFAGQTTVSGNYTVGTGESSADLNVMSIVMDSGVAKDAYGNPLSLNLPAGHNLADNKALVIDAVVPTITNINSLKADGTYGVGAVITIDITFDKAITTTGDMKITLDTSAEITIGSFAGQTTVSGNYTVGTGESSADLNVMSIVMDSGVATDAYGNSLSLNLPAGHNLADNNALVIDGIFPFITQIDSSTINGSYGAGANINVKISFSEPITLVGTMSVFLDSGGSFDLTDFSGSDVSGVYTVLLGENSDDLKVNAIVVDGSVYDVGLNDLNLGLPLANNLNHNNDIVIDTVSPTIISILSNTADGYYKAGDSISITISFSESVTLASGTLSVDLSSGGNVDFMPFSGTSTTALYTITNGDNTLVLDAVALNLLTGTLEDAAGNPVIITVPVSNISSTNVIVVDTVEPTITGALLGANSVSLDITFSEGVYTNATGAGALNLSDFDLTFDQNGGTVTNVVMTGIIDPSGVFLVGGENTVRIMLEITGGIAGLETILVSPKLNEIFDKAGNPTSITASTGLMTLTDTIAPMVVNVSSSKANGHYKKDEVIDIDITFNEIVTVTGTPQLLLATGGSGAYAEYISGDISYVLTFRYVVADGHNSADLDYTATTSLLLNGGTIDDLSNNNAVLILPAPGVPSSLGANKNLVIDTVAPKIESGVLGELNGYVDITFSEGVYTVGSTSGLQVSDLQVVINSNGGSATGVTITAVKTTTDSPLIGGETTVRVFLEFDNSASGVETIVIGPTPNKIFDKAGNAAISSEGTDALTLEITGETPFVTRVYGVSPDGAYSVGKKILIAVEFSEEVNVFDVPSLLLDVSKEGRKAIYKEKLNATTLIFSYTVNLGESSADLNYMATTALSSGYGLIKSIKGIKANVLLPELDSLDSLAFNSDIVVDTVLPYIKKIDTNQLDGIYGIGTTLSLYIHTNRSVSLSKGSLYVSLNSGAIVEIGAFELTSEILVSYIVGENQQTLDLDVLSLTLSEDAVLLDELGNELNLGLKSPNLSIRHDIKILAREYDFVITATASLGGRTNHSGSISVFSNSQKTITIQAYAGYYIENVFVDDEPIGPRSSYVFENIQADHTLHARFAPMDGSYIITTISGVGGQFNIEGPISVLQGEAFTIEALADFGYYLYDLQVDGKSQGASTTYTISNVQSAHTIKAIFQKSTLHATIVSNALTGGTISPRGFTQVMLNTSQRYQITPFEGYHVRDVLVDGKSVGHVHEYEFIDVAENHSIKVVFEKTLESYEIKASSTNNGEIIPAGISKVLSGANQSYVFKPQSGHHVSQVIVDGRLLGRLSEYTFENINHHHEVSVIYQKTKPFYHVASSVGHDGSKASIQSTVKGNVAHGSEIDFEIFAEEGHHIIDILINGFSIDLYDLSRIVYHKKLKWNDPSFRKNANFTLRDVQEDIYIKVKTAPEQEYYYLVTDIRGDGYINIETPRRVALNEDVFFTITPDKFSILSDVIIDGESVGPIRYVYINGMVKDITVRVVFEKVKMENKIKAGTYGLGQISPMGTIWIKPGGRQTFTFTPEQGYQLEDLIIDGRALKASMPILPSSGYTFDDVVMDHSIEAVFSKIEKVYQITATASKGGYLSNAGTVDVLAGESYECEIRPSELVLPHT